MIAACGGTKGKATTAATRATPAGAETHTTTPAPATGSHEISAHMVAASTSALAATLHVSGGHHPRVGASWPIAFTVSRAGRPARATVSYEYLFGGAVVARRSHYSFTGSFHDVFQWPASAVGYPLTFRAVIVSDTRTLNLDYPVQVVR